MEEYIVSARKYRPASFDTVVGQRALTTTLLNAIRLGKLAHAYLFCGPRGVGKTTCARIFAKTINCMSPGENMEACNECESCHAFDEGRSMNIHELDAASNNSVDDIRELIKQVQIPPQIGRYKVFIIDEVHMLSTAAFNAFLKTLEEPPSYAIFILATTEKHKILPTILSRCQVYDFQRMTIKNTVDHLRYVAEKEGVNADEEALNLIAQKADGGMRDALSIFDQVVSFSGGNVTYQQALQNLNVLDSEYYFRLVDHFLKHEVEPCMMLLNEVINRGFDAGVFIGGLAGHLRDVLVARDAVTLELLEVSDTMKERFKEQAQRCEPRFLYRAIKLCNECDQSYRTSRNKRLQVEICLIECAQEDDILGRGRRPKTLKPLFKVPATQLLTGQQTVASANTRPATPSRDNTPQPAPVATQTTATTTAGVTAGIRQTGGATNSLRSIKNNAIPSLSRPFTSIHDQGTENPELKGLNVQTDVPARAETAQTATAKPQGNQENPAPVAQAPKPQVLPFTEENVILWWQEYATRLPKEHIAMTQRMRGITPQLAGEKKFTITASNAQMKKDLDLYAPYIKDYFEKRMGESGITMEVLVAEKQDIHIYTKPEILQRMIERNSNIQQLKEMLQLEYE